MSEKLPAVTQHDDLEPIKGIYTEEIVTAGLTALAAHGGHTTRAHALIKELYGDKAPTDRTLREWRETKYPRRYQSILREHAHELEATVEHQLREAIVTTGHIEHRALERLAAELDALPAKELPKALQALSTTRGIDIDKLLTITGRPDSIVEHRSADEILRGIEALVNGGIIDSTAEEIPHGTD